MALIPADNVVPWEPGVDVGIVGGIPTNRTEYVNLVTEGVDNTGATDVSAAINAFLDSCPENQYVYAPAGTYRCDSTLVFPIGNPNTSLVGDGETTIISTSNPSYGIYAGTGDAVGPPFGFNNVDVKVSAGLTKGSDTVTIADASGFEVGRHFILVVENDPDLPMMSVAGYDYVTGQTCVIVSKTATTITFDPPLYSAYGGGTLDAYVYTTQNGFRSVGNGIENLLIDCNDTSQNGINFERCISCWVKNVRIRGFGNYGITMQTCSRMEVRTCWIEERSGGGTNGSGILLNSVSASLIEDNIVNNIQPPIEQNQSSSGNVFTYNYLTGAVGVDANHGHNPQFNVFEGNWWSTYIEDGYFGTTNRNTLYRNYSLGTISLKRFSRNCAVVCNIFPTEIQFGLPNIGNTGFTGESDFPGDPWADYGITGEITTRTGDNDAVVTVSSVGQMVNGFQGIYVVWGTPLVQLRHVGEIDGITGLEISITEWVGIAPGDAFPIVGTDVLVFTGSAGYQEKDLAVESSTDLKGNWYIDSETQDPMGGETMVDSIVYDAEPSWWSGPAWPPYDPFNPGNAEVTNIPAGVRFSGGGGGGTTITVANVTNFNVL